MVNTLELRGIETYSPEIQTFLREIEKSFLQVLNNCVPADQQEKEAIQLRQRVSATDNETKREQALLAAAKEANILELFVPTFFHQLPVTQLDDTNSSRYTYDSHYHTWRQNPDIEAFELNYLEIQPIVVPASHVAYENIGWDEQGEVIPGISMTVIRRIPTRNLTWLKSIVENYSKEFFEKFAIFCDDWHIWDLHEDNIGFLRTPEVELPIILDWMSD